MPKIIKCKTCSKEIASSAKFCSSCGAKNKKPIYKRGWFIGLVVLFVIIGLVGGNGSKNPSSNVASKQKVSENEQTEEVSSTEEKVPKEYKSALKKAQSYSDTQSMSKAGLYDQLTSEYGEKFQKEAAQYAIDNVKADWKENALKKAKSYSEGQSMSKDSVYDQLISEYGEKFTKEEAQYAVDHMDQ